MAKMFDYNNQPMGGYGQYSPYKDVPKQRNNPLQNAIQQNPGPSWVPDPPRSKPPGEQGFSASGPGTGYVQEINSKPEAVVGGGAGVNVRKDIPSYDTSKWDTDQYAAPQYTASKVGNILQGYDQGNWDNPNMQTPKYVIGRILSNYQAGAEGLRQALPEIQRAYKGASIVDHPTGDLLSIPGVGTTDVIQNAGANNAAWQWLDPNQGGGGGGLAPGIPGSPLSSAILKQNMQQVPDAEQAHSLLPQLIAMLQQSVRGY